MSYIVGGAQSGAQRHRGDGLTALAAVGGP